MSYPINSKEDLIKALAGLDESTLKESGLEKVKEGMKSLNNLTEEQIKSQIRLKKSEVDLALMRNDQMEAAHALFELETRINELRAKGITITEGMTDAEEKAVKSREKEYNSLIKAAEGYEKMGVVAKELTKDQQKLKGISDSFFDSFTKSTGIALSSSEGLAGGVTEFAAAFKNADNNVGVIINSFKKYINVTTVANAMVSRMFEATLEMAKAFDAASTSLAAATGAGDKFSQTLLDVRLEGNRLGVNFENAGAAIRGLASNFQGFVLVGEKTQKQLITTTALLGRMGVDATLTTSILNTLTINMGMNASAATEMTKKLVQMGSELGDAGKFLNDFNQAQSVLAVYGNKSIQIFSNLAAAAKAAGVETSTLLQIAGKFDTFASAAESVGKLNAILGSQLSSTQMLMMTEDQRIETLIQQVQVSGQSFANLDRFKQKAIAAAAGITDMNEANRIFGMNIKQYKAYQQRMESVTNVQENFQKAADATIGIQEKLSILFAEFAIFAKPMLDFFESIIEGLTYFISKVSFTGKAITLFTSVLVVLASAMGGFKIVTAAFSAAASALGGAAPIIKVGGTAISKVIEAMGAATFKAAPGFLAFGAAVALTGAGVYMAASGLALLAAELGGIADKGTALLKFVGALYGLSGALTALIVAGALGSVGVFGVNYALDNIAEGIREINAAINENTEIQSTLENLALISTGTSAKSMTQGAGAAVEGIKEAISAAYEQKIEITLTINDGALKDFIEAEVTNKDLATKIVAEATT